MKSKGMPRTMASPRISESIRIIYFPEPLIVFGDHGLHVDPKAGIARHGPRSFSPPRRHPRQVRVGIIGTAETIELAREWMIQCADGVAGNEKHPEFPGFRGDRGFFSDLIFDDSWNELLTQREVKSLLEIKNSKDRFLQTVDLLEGKLRLLAERDHPPEYVVFSLPSVLLRRCSVANYQDKSLGQVHRDLRRALKAAAMRYRIPTQIMREQTLARTDESQLSRVAWNFFTGLYFKAGGLPWGPHGLSPGTCYVGIGFFRPLGSAFPTIQTTVVQAFDENGEGLVLRGHDFEWDPEKEGSRSPHLSEELAARLLEMVLSRYQQEMKRAPRRVVVHKTSRYWSAERSGMEAVLRNRVDRFDLVALEPQSEVRLITVSKYPPLRGTAFSVGNLDYLYTTGFIAAKNEFHGVHVPSPLRIADHLGQDTSRQELLQEILMLTKMNWNSAGFGGLLPITLRFSRAFGEIMREIPRDRDPLPQFKFYV